MSKLAIPWSVDLPLDMLFTTPQAAAYLGKSASTLRAWRGRRIGPRYILYEEGGVRYPLRELDTWRARAAPNVVLLATWRK